MYLNVEVACGPCWNVIIDHRQIFATTNVQPRIAHNTSVVLVQLLRMCLMLAEGQPAERCQGHVVLNAYCGDQRPATPHLRLFDVQHASR
jgi:hypothetical protein